MTHTTDNARRRAATPLLLLVAASLGIGGCANISFPELPQGLMRPTAQAEPEDTAEGVEDTSAEEQVAETIEPPAEPEEAKPAQLYEWNGDGRDVTRVVIDTNEQTAHFYAGEDQLGWTTIASGVAKHPTPRGEFAVLEKVRDKRSNLYGKIVSSNGKTIRGSAHGRDPVPRGARFLGASMPNFMRLTYDGIGMHAGPIPNPGQPASHGCIRMPPKMASTVFEHISNGTRVTVVGDGPDYGNYAERIARERAEQQARRAAAAAAAQGTALDALDAEIEVLERAGVGDNKGAAEAETKEKAKAKAQSEPSPKQRAKDETGGGDDSADRSDGQDAGEGNAEAAGADAVSEAASARPTADADDTAAETRQPDAQSSSGSSTDSSSAPSSASKSTRASATPTAQHSPTSERASAPQEPEDAPRQPTPAEQSEDDTAEPPAYYGPPTPPPAMHSASTATPSVAI